MCSQLFDCGRSLVVPLTGRDSSQVCEGMSCQPRLLWLRLPFVRRALLCLRVCHITWHRRGCPLTLFSAIHACVLQTFKLSFFFFCWWSTRRVGGLIQVGLKFCLLLYSWPPGALISVYQHPETSYFHKTLSSGRVTMHVNIAADAGNGCCEPHLRDNPMQIHLTISVSRKAHTAMRKWPGVTCV